MKEKTKRKKSLIDFFIVLLISLLAVFFAHLAIKKTMGELLFSNRIIESYLLNFCLGYTSFIVLIFSIKKYMSSLGYILIYISFLINNTTIKLLEKIGINFHPIPQVIIRRVIHQANQGHHPPARLFLMRPCYRFILTRGLPLCHSAQCWQ